MTYTPAMDDKLDRILTGQETQWAAITEIRTKVTEIDTRLFTRGGLQDRLEKVESSAEESKTFRTKLTAMAAAIAFAAGGIGAKIISMFTAIDKTKP